MSKALVLTGGGARAAYQVGVLKGISKILPRSVYNPFPIICGTSAGAINALSIAGRAGPFRLRAQKLERIWHELTPADVYRTDATGVIKTPSICSPLLFTAATVLASLSLCSTIVRYAR